jgi:predicted dehydrogenase
MDFEDSAMCLAKFDSGTVAVINVGWFSQQYALKLDLYGSVGNTSAQHLPANPLSAAAQMLATGYQRFHQGHVDELQHFISCIIKDLSPSPTAHDGLKDMEAISLAYKNKIVLE